MSTVSIIKINNVQSIKVIRQTNGMVKVYFFGANQSDRYYAHAFRPTQAQYNKFIKALVNGDTLEYQMFPSQPEPLLHSCGSRRAEIRQIQTARFGPKNVTRCYMHDIGHVMYEPQ